MSYFVSLYFRLSFAEFHDLMFSLYVFLQLKYSSYCLIHIACRKRRFFLVEWTFRVLAKDSSVIECNQFKIV